jgi:hypothetical protein
MPLDEPLASLLHRRLVQLPKSAAERHEILIGERLIAEEEHLMIEPRAMDCREQLIVEHTKIDAIDPGAERRTRGSNTKAIGAA